MSGPQSPDGSVPAPVPAGDPEALLRQALRAQVGGPKGASRGGPVPDGARDEPRMTVFARLTAAQILLIAALIGLIVGMTVAFARL